MFHRHYLIQFSKLPQEAEILFIISILWMKKLRLREGKRLTQGHTLFTTTPYCLSINFPLLKSVRACSVFVSNSLKPHELQPARLPCPWDSPGKNTGVGCHFLLQGGSSQSRDQTHVSCISCVSRQILYYCAIWEAFLLRALLPNE